MQGDIYYGTTYGGNKPVKNMVRKLCRKFVDHAHTLCTGNFGPYNDNMGGNTTYETTMRGDNADRRRHSEWGG